MNDASKLRSMAAESGFLHTTIRRIWTAFGLQPHRSETFKLSNDPLFVDKYLSPPSRALVLSVDEKSQIQALDREQPVLPMMPGIAYPMIAVPMIIDANVPIPVSKKRPTAPP